MPPFEVSVKPGPAQSPRPRVARAQKNIRLHPFLCSASKKGTWPLPLLLADFFNILRGSGWGTRNRT